MNERLVAVGVDGCRAGWVAACLFREDATQRLRTELQLFASVAELAAFRHGDAIVAIDVPIGLTDGDEGRECDREARRRLGRRGSSVFAAPSRWMLAYATDYGALRAQVAQQRAAGRQVKSLSAQAHGITPKIKEVDTWLSEHPDADAWLLECHPELSFMALNGGLPVAAPKKTAAGKLQRRRCLAAVFPDAPSCVDNAPWPRSQVALDDLLDAYACLHTALAVSRGEHTTLGGQLDATGRPMQMVTARP
ncbi:MAG: DUF429 domain-containing protein [Solirubrobacteraceae bacterium]|nr:DUF429 domain-containing protein [Solirubrobacteraceae bacterium]